MHNGKNQEDNDSEDDIELLGTLFICGRPKGSTNADKMDDHKQYEGCVSAIANGCLA